VPPSSSSPQQLSACTPIETTAGPGETAVCEGSARPTLDSSDLARPVSLKRGDGGQGLDSVDLLHLRSLCLCLAPLPSPIPPHSPSPHPRTLTTVSGLTAPHRRRQIPSHPPPQDPPVNPSASSRLEHAARKHATAASLARRLLPISVFLSLREPTLIRAPLPPHPRLSAPSPATLSLQPSPSPFRAAIPLSPRPPQFPSRHHAARG
jgi:hypothetical protein